MMSEPLDIFGNSLPSGSIPRRRSPGCIRWLMAILLVFSFALNAESRQNHNRRRKNRPEVRTQDLERMLSGKALSQNERVRLSLRLAQRYFELNNETGEAAILEDMLAKSITNPSLAADAHYYLGRNYQKRGLNDQAIEQFLWVWDKHPKSRYLYHAALQLGDLMLLKGREDIAREWYGKVVRGAPAASVAFLARDKLADIGLGECVSEITAESSRPKSIKNQFQKLHRHLYDCSFDQADSIARDLIASRTNTSLRAAINYHLAHSYWMHGDVEGAVRFIPEAIKVDGDRRAKALVLAGHICRAMGDECTALDYYEAAIDAAPDKPFLLSAYQHSARMLLRMGQEAEALALVARGKKAYAGGDRHAVYLDRMSDALRERAHPDWRMYAQQTAAVSTNHIGFRAIQKLGRDAVLRNDWKQAEDLYRQLTQRPVSDRKQAVEVRLALINSMLQQGKKTDAAAVEAGLALSPGKRRGPDERAYVLYRLGRTLKKAGYADRAELYWREAVRRYSKSRYAAMAQGNLARLLEERGDPAAAMAAWEQYLEMSAGEPQFVLHAKGQLARLNMKLGNVFSGRELLDAARTRALAIGDAEKLLNLAQYYRFRVDESTARDLLEEGLRLAGQKMLAEEDAAKRLWWMHLIARRLYDFNEYEWMGDCARQFDLGLLQDPLLDASARIAIYCYLMLGLEQSGRWAEAEALCREAIRIVPEDSPWLAHVLYRMQQQALYRGESVGVREIADQAFNEVPTSYISQYMWLQVAVEDVRLGHFDEALKKLEALGAAVVVARLAPDGWAASFQWDIAYLKGRCLAEIGYAVEGTGLMEEALNQKPEVARLYGHSEP